MPMLILILGIVFCDQASKYYIQETMSLGMSLPVIADSLHITYILNRGAAFGILENQRVFFIAIAMVMILALIRFYRKIAGHHLLIRWGTALLAGGAAGNLIDRMRIGAVIDFIDFRVWPIFNVADIAIVCGVSMMMYALLFLSNIKDEEYEAK